MLVGLVGALGMAGEHPLLRSRCKTTFQNAKKSNLQQLDTIGAPCIPTVWGESSTSLSEVVEEKG
jgi:hypothetical protein